jgi:hypothetical protein
VSQIDETTLTDTPIFSPRLDEVLGMMLDGEAPNLGRFCGYCYTPLSKSADACPHCDRPVADTGTLDRVPAEVIEMYKRMRKRESLIVNSFAFAGLFLGVLLFMVIVAIDVYLVDQSWWLLVVALVVLLVSGRVFAGILGGWIGDDVGYRHAHRKLVIEWVAFERARTGGGVPAPPADVPATQSR